ncbi:mast cell protease 4 [Astyanax mexicanus]|uniref:mast cell protease 4 n=1 Tax=Astyanax mexicanus TaxID=7994 RepID=UPI0020CB6418|nr:mast cell protease 4 [Astyanax mexicanus]
MALIPLLLLAVLLPTSCHSASMKVGIINGTEAKEHSRPYMVSIQYHKQHICGGFLITDSFVMTAAHCASKIENINWEDVTAVVGAHNLSTNNFERIAVKEHYSHPNFSAPHNDIMLLKLGKSSANSRNTRCISIDVKRDRYSNCSVAGWGIKNDGMRSDVVREAKIRIITDNCKLWWSFFNDSTMLCAGGRNSGICQGDSGSPLVCNNLAVGIVAFQEKDCFHPKQPNGYTRISAFLPWINKILKK